MDVPIRQAGDGALLLSAAVLNLLRMARWAGNRTVRDPLVFVLHVAYGFVPLGLALAGLTIVIPEIVPPAAAVHAFGVGAVGCMTLAVMTRATLGHTGRELRADIGTCAIYAAIVGAGLLRVAAAFAPAEIMLLYASAALWMGAFSAMSLCLVGCWSGPNFVRASLVHPMLEAGKKRLMTVSNNREFMDGFGGHSPRGLRPLIPVVVSTT